MQITASSIPTHSQLSREAASAYFHDSHAVRLTRTELTALQIFGRIFGPPPSWLRVLLKIRNSVMSTFFRLDSPTAAQIDNIVIKDAYAIGERIGGLWPICSLSDTEIVAGRDNRHLDFRVSILKLADQDGATAFVTTVCHVHGRFGKCYLFLIAPFHKFSVKRLMADAAAAGRV